MSIRDAQLRGLQAVKEFQASKGLGYTVCRDARLQALKERLMEEAHDGKQ